MKSVNKDKNLKLSNDDFKKPDIEFTIETNCAEFKQPTNTTAGSDEIDPFQR